MNQFYLQINKSVFSFKKINNPKLNEKIENYININLRFNKDVKFYASKNVLYLDYREFYEIVKINYPSYVVKSYFESGVIPEIFICYLSSDNRIIRISRKEKYYTHTLVNPDVKNYPNNVSISRKRESNLILPDFMLTFSGYLRPIEEFQTDFI